MQLVGRTVHRIILHNGIHLGAPGAGFIAKTILHVDKVKNMISPMGKLGADEMVLTPIGVFLRFEKEKLEKVVPFANIYELDLAPEAAVEKVAKEPKPAKIEKAVA